MDARWLDDRELAAWVRVVAVLELLPGVLDTQLRRDAGLTHFDYYVLAALSASPEQTLRMTSLAQQTNSTLARLSNVVRRLEERALVERFPAPQDARVTNARLTEQGRQKLQQAAPGHVETVREHVIDALTPEQVDQLSTISEAILGRLDRDGSMAVVYHRFDRGTPGEGP